MYQIKNQLYQCLLAYITTIDPSYKDKVVIETNKDDNHGDFSCSIALQLAKPLKKSPRKIAEEVKTYVENQTSLNLWVHRIDIAGPGFLNFYLKLQAKQQLIHEVLTTGKDYGTQEKNGKKILVEFVSANPTGPLHVGHGRQAALGDAICKLYQSQGWQVWREFYYNDSGVQIQNLALSVQARAKGYQPGDDDWPEAAYNGEYITDIAKAFIQQSSIHRGGETVTAYGDIDDLEQIRRFAVAYLRREQDIDLQAFNLQFDGYFLESSLYTHGQVEKIVERLQTNGYCYEEAGALWLKTTKFGDDKDRVMRKSDASYTYFVPDIAYHQNKWERGFHRAINIQGTDHHGTIKRVRAGLQALEVGITKDYPDYLLHTMVRVVRDGQEVKLSKRTGSYVTLRDVIDWTSTDAVRFFLLSRKPDTPYIFDVDLARSQNNQNPVYYVQYAHARICTIFKTWGGDIKTLAKADLSLLKSPQAMQLILHIARYPEVLTTATYDFAPHDITFYLRDLAATYHSYYDAERILVEDPPLQLARLALITACAQTLKNGLAILGVSAPSKM
jgi:arginyl-tRNA synthetase